MGHLFVVQGDVTRIHADAWLLPTDATLRVSEGWEAPLRERGIDVAGRSVQAQPPARWEDGSVRAFELVPKSREGPAIIATNTGGHTLSDPAWYTTGVAEAVVVAGRRGALRVCLPVVATGEGGKRGAKGQVLAPLVLGLNDVATGGSIDVVLVAREAASFAAAQQVRRADQSRYWPDQADAALAERLAGHAREGRLVLFLGAGIGREVGLPGWDALLRELAEDMGGNLDGFDELPAVDRARVLETRLGTDALRQGIVDRFSGLTRVSLAHALLASLPVRESVTTNYDDLFEQAAKCCGRPVAILPYDSVRDADRWLLKLHGDVAHGDDIVITRDDYLGFPAGRRALTGIVQSLLITRHMLFVGFSLRDDNFHQIAYDVRKAAPRQGETGSSFGTALFLEEVDLLRTVWGDDLAIETMGSAGHAGERQLLMFLDRLLAESTTVFGHLLDESFDDQLTDGQRLVRDALQSALELARNDPTLRSLLASSLAPFGAPVNRP